MTDAESGGDLRLLRGEDLHEEVFLRGILRAREKVRLATANLKNFTIPEGAGRKSFVSCLRDLARAKVRIEILHGAVPSQPFLDEIRKSTPLPPGSFTMKFCPRLHLKAAVVDYRDLYLGTANFTGAGLGARSAKTRNFELGLWTRSEALVDAVMLLFDRVWTGEACSDCGRRRQCPEPLESISF